MSKVFGLSFVGLVDLLLNKKNEKSLVVWLGRRDYFYLKEIRLKKDLFWRIEGFLFCLKLCVRRCG